MHRDELELNLQVRTSQTTIPPDQASMDTYFVYCKGSRELLQGRIAKRKGHFMGAQVSCLRVKCYLEVIS